VVEFGPGTGRLTAMGAQRRRGITLLTNPPQMLDLARAKMVAIGGDNWTVQVADNFHLPLADGVADVAIEGWSFGHYVDWSLPDWQPVLAACSPKWIGSASRARRKSFWKRWERGMNADHHLPRIRSVPAMAGAMSWVSPAVDSHRLPIRIPR
jgi:hypothetical protein